MKEEKGGGSAGNKLMISSSWTAHCVPCFFRLKIPSLKMTPRSWKILLSDSYRWFLCPYFQRCDKSKHKPWLLSGLISFVCTDFIRAWNMGVLNIWHFSFNLSYQHPSDGVKARTFYPHFIQGKLQLRDYKSFIHLFMHSFDRYFLSAYHLQVTVVSIIIY